VLWVAEDKQLMANPNRLAAGTVIEAHLDKKRGPVATLLVQVSVFLGGGRVEAPAAGGEGQGMGAGQEAPHDNQGVGRG
jgi:translation initiation factor IF-2